MHKRLLQQEFAVRQRLRVPEAVCAQQVNQKGLLGESCDIREVVPAALVELINRKRSGERIIDTTRPRETGNVISLMDALKRSLGKEGGSAKPTKGKKARKRIEGQSEMLLPISGGAKRAAKDQPKKVVKVARSTGRSRKAAR